MVLDSLVKNRAFYNLEQGRFLHPLPCANLTCPPAPHLNRAVKIPPEGGWRSRKGGDPKQEGK